MLIGCDYEQFGGYGDEVGYIICTGCRTEVYFGLVNEEQAAEHWNRRVNDMKKVDFKHCTCGAIPNIRTVIRVGDQMPKIFIMCDECGKKSNEWITVLEAVADWNKDIYTTNSTRTRFIGTGE